MRVRILSSLTLALAALSPRLDAQSCSLVCDINRISSPLSSSPSGARSGPGGTWAPGFARCGKYWYFTAATTATGSELWKTDGTASGTAMVKDINPGGAGSSISYITCCNGRIFFRATTAGAGSELWVSDGTAAGTRMVKDMYPGAGSSSPSHLECLGNKVVFAANDGRNGIELWISDGTGSGTVLVKDIRAGSLSGSPRYMKANSAGNLIYFAASDGTRGTELWRTDGTSAGTVLVKDIRSGSSSSSPVYFNNLAGKTVFRAWGPNGTGLWETDGTAGGTRRLKDIRPGLSPSARIGNKLYFTADDGVTGAELWETDGTAAGTKLAADVRPGPLSSSPSWLVAAGNTLFFGATGTSGGHELYKFAGGAASLVKDIRPGASGSLPSRIAHLGGGKVLFSADDGTNGIEPWISDGTAAGTRMLKDLRAGPSWSSPSWITVTAPGRALFVATDDKSGRELFLTSGASTGTTLFKDLEPGVSTADSRPSALTCAWGGTLYLRANDGKNGDEPWIHDPRTGRCSLLKDIDPGSSSSWPAAFTPCWTGERALVFFTARDATHGTELWVTDGTTAGTVLVKDIRPGPSSSEILYLTCFQGRVYFRANDGRNGSELWCSDGTSTGTKMVKDIRAGSGSSSPAALAYCKGTLFFTADDGTNGVELWKTDGTSAGTVMVKDIRAGGLSSFPSLLVCCGERVVFRANNDNGTELWVSDGTPAGTTMVKDIRPGVASSYPSNFTRCGKRIFFTADDGAHGIELWVSDLTAAGTRMVKDIFPGASSSSPSNLVCCDGKLFFSAFVSLIARGHGRELWTSDGTTAGTKMVKDIYGGYRSSSPSYLTCVGTQLYFTAFVSWPFRGHGRELWTSDGTSVGTKEVCDLYPGGSSSSPSYLTLCSGRLYFAATDPIKGRELFVVELPGASVELLGRGCAPSFPTLESTAPNLGGTAVLTSRRGPAGHVGFLALGIPGATPSGMPFSGPCALWLDIVNAPVVPIGGPSTTPAFTRKLPIPNQPGLQGGKIVLQTLWLNAATPFPIQGSNGAQLTVGK